MSFTDHLRPQNNDDTVFASNITRLRSRTRRHALLHQDPGCTVAMVNRHGEHSKATRSATARPQA